MVVYRICREAFADSLTASGMAGRWNLQGQHVLYASATRSLAALEQLANRSGLSMREPYTVMVIELTDRPEAYEVVDTVDLPSDWQRLSGYSRLQELGGTWYRQQRSLVLRVPSVLVPQESNFVINTSHPDFVTSVKVVGREDFGWDNRLV
jgi:RES domain-containing protein